MSECGVHRINSRSLNVPGSDSSALQSRKWGLPEFIGMNDHFTPVGNPAPPRPRRPEFLTTLMTSAREPPSALRSARYPPRSSQPLSVRAPGSPKYFDRTRVSLGCLYGYAMLGYALNSKFTITSRQRSQNLRNVFGLDVLIVLFIDLDDSREAACAEALDLHDGPETIVGDHSGLGAGVFQECLQHGIS